MTQFNVQAYIELLILTFNMIRPCNWDKLRAYLPHFAIFLQQIWSIISFL